MKFYAKIDWTAKKSNPTFGFANSKKIVALDSRKERDNFLCERSHYDFSARTHAEYIDKDGFACIEHGTSKTDGFFDFVPIVQKF